MLPTITTAIATHKGVSTSDQDQLIDPISFRIINTINKGPKKDFFIVIDF
jgi:hypothetical protein